MIRYTKGYKYQLYEDAEFQTNVFPENDIVTRYITLTTTGLLGIKLGYAWDGASGTTIDTESSMQGALGHDALYQLMRMGLLDQKWRHEADRFLRDQCKSDGMWKWRAELWYNAVRKIAGFAADPKNRKKVYTAGR